eukprot:403341749
MKKYIAILSILAPLLLLSSLSNQVQAQSEIEQVDFEAFFRKSINETITLIKKAKDDKRFLQTSTTNTTKTNTTNSTTKTNTTTNTTNTTKTNTTTNTSTPNTPPKKNFTDSGIYTSDFLVYVMRSKNTSTYLQNKENVYKEAMNIQQTRYLVAGLKELLQQYPEAFSLVPSDVLAQYRDVLLELNNVFQSMFNTNLFGNLDLYNTQVLQDVYLNGDFTSFSSLQLAAKNLEDEKYSSSGSSSSSSTSESVELFLDIGLPIILGKVKDGRLRWVCRKSVKKCKCLKKRHHKHNKHHHQTHPHNGTMSVQPMYNGQTDPGFKHQQLNVTDYSAANMSAYPQYQTGMTGPDQYGQNMII